MNYIGSKRKLSEWLINSMSAKCDLDGVDFLDAFGGTSIVSQHMRQRAKVTTVDVELYAYTLAKHYIEGVDPYTETIAQLATTSPVSGFIHQNYCVDRMYWTQENGQLIDGIRQAIDNLSSETEQTAALCALLEAADAVANTASVYGAYLKKIKSSAAATLLLKAISPALGSPGKAIHADILTLSLSGDVAYLDPPYNARHYGSNYHLLNTICHYQPFIPKGVTGLPDYYKSPFCSKVKARGAMQQLLDQLDYRDIFISYNDEGIITLEEMASICEQHGTYSLIERDYQRFKANDGKQRQTQTVEYLHHVKR